MKTRSQPLTIPDKPIYFAVEVPGHGRHDFRRPGLTRMVRLINSIPASVTALITSLTRFPPSSLIQSTPASLK